MTVQKPLLLLVEIGAVVAILSFVLFLRHGHGGVTVPTVTKSASAATTADRAGFLAAYRRAHESGDVDAAVRLVYRAGVGQRVWENLRASFEDDFSLSISRLEIVPLAPTDKLEYTVRGTRYVPNLTPVGKLRITLSSKAGTHSTTTYLVRVR